MNRTELIDLIRTKKSFLCIGLDTDINKIPKSLVRESDDPLFEFNRRIIDATNEFAVAYKPNLAFYESQGSRGWLSLERTMEYLHGKLRGKVFTIADAKRGDIGNTSEHYARAFFEKMDFDAVTLNPYMGYDSLKPFLNETGKWAIVLALTSNPGSNDFQLWQPQLPQLLSRMGIRTEQWKRLFELIVEQCLQWGTCENMMFVAGATHPELLRVFRELAPKHFLLVPGVGTQGGSLTQVAEAVMTKDCGLLVNASRNIIYASRQDDFEDAARQSAQNIQNEMQKLLALKGII
ncbi:MAG TPA: orotidine-5'-phosphate decarboxylase [Bacteroidales bacterium]|nr:orotidine-5'-phosphate decarboxylase [Bacteroidales bacterium]